MGMKQPNSQNEIANKALQVTAHKAPNLNADVRINNNGLPHDQWTFHTVNRKSIDNAVTIWDRSRA